MVKFLSQFCCGADLKKSFHGTTARCPSRQSEGRIGFVFIICSKFVVMVVLGLAIDDGFLPFVRETSSRLVINPMYEALYQYVANYCELEELAFILAKNSVMRDVRK
jgi:hypothetical protein